MNLPDGLTGRPIAHRGLWRPGMRPENSLAAFEAACAGGFGIELDVQLTADGEAVVFHDHDLDRMTTESGLVEERTAEELGRLHLLGGECQTIPLLAEALDLIAGRALVLIELKTPPGQEGPLEARTAELLAAYAGPVGVLSFNAAALATPELGAFAKGLNLSDPAHAAETNSVDFLSINKALSDNPSVRTWRSAGRPVIAWTVRNRQEQEALQGRVDNVVFEGFQP